MSFAVLEFTVGFVFGMIISAWIALFKMQKYTERANYLNKLVMIESIYIIIVVSVSVLAFLVRIWSVRIGK